MEFLSLFINELNDIIIDFEEFHYNKNSLIKLNKKQIQDLIHLLSKWFPENSPKQINNLINSILKNKDIKKEKYKLKANVSEFCFLLSFLIKNKFTLKENIVRIFDLNIFTHSIYKINKSIFRSHLSKYNFDESIKINIKSTRYKKLLINFINNFSPSI